MSHSSLTVAKHFLDCAEKKGIGLSPMKLIKLVYIAHGWMLGLNGRPLIRETIEAWRYGPSIPELHRAVRKFRTDPVDPKAVRPPWFSGRRGLDEEEKAIIEETLEGYGHLTAIQLSQMTHARGTPWDIIRNRIGESRIIPDPLIRYHYEELDRKYSEDTADD